MKKKMFDASLHGTRNTKDHTKYGLTNVPNSGEGFSKKAGKYYKYTNLNSEGKTNTLIWL